jgi:hypothetical protein
MPIIQRIMLSFSSAIALLGCSKKSSDPPAVVIPPVNITSTAVKVNGMQNATTYKNVNFSPVVKFTFNTPVNRSTAPNAISFQQNAGAVAYSVSYENGDSTIVVQPSTALRSLTKFNVGVTSSLASANGTLLRSPVSVTLITGIDSTNKFPIISDNALLDLVQRQTFKYFWDFGHPTSGLARERNNSGDLVTSGGSGFGIMAIVTAVSRNFITRSEGLARMQKIVGFLKNNAQKFHGAFPHWLNGSTGVVIPFSEKDNGADLVETSFLMQGLLTARQYFNTADAVETTLRSDINSLYNGVEWNWFRKNNENVLYWHWSPTNNWDMNHQIKGWNECLITYLLAAASPTYSIPKAVYDEGWASSGAIKNNNTYQGIPLPLGPAFGGPLFFEHYSFLGINPNGLSDQYANYQQQVVNHTKINYEYVKANPKGYYGYSNAVWGLTASDIPNGYTASSPTNDVGVIAPTAALSSMPYTPAESMNALRFFYYKLGDRLWQEYGFIDAFNLDDPWFAGSFLAIDQGPIIVMIENHRSGLLWNLFTSCPEVKEGMRKLAFSAPYL